MHYLTTAWNNLYTYITSPEVLNEIINNRFFLILFVLILSSLRHGVYHSMFMASLINMPGTILHEIAHFTIGLILNAKPTKFSLFPHKSEKGYVMGSVGFRNLNFYNSLPSAMAPLLLLVAAYYIDKNFFKFFEINLINYLLYVLLLSIIIENAMPSSTDFRVGFKYITGNLIYLTLLIAFLIIFL